MERECMERDNEDPGSRDNGHASLCQLPLKAKETLALGGNVLDIKAVMAHSAI
jgi:hypothetical protein